MAQQTAPKISLKDPAVRAELAKKVGKVMTITGKLCGGDPITKLEGEALAEDIKYQKEKQKRKFPVTDPHYKFRISDAVLTLKDKDAAERYLYQQIYSDQEGVKRFSVETKNNFTIGYCTPEGKIRPIKRETLAGKKFAFGQEVTLTYSVYMNKSTEEASIGFENMFFSQKPEFYIPEFNADTVGVVEGQGWDTSELEDFSEEEGTVIAPTAAPADNAEGNAEGNTGGSEDSLWDNNWE